MDKFDSDFEKIENAAADKRRQQDFDDLQNEMSGSNVGRIQRFLSSDGRAAILAKRNGQASAAMSALDLLLLNNPGYAEVYENTMDRLGELEKATERAISQTTNAIREQEEALQNTLSNAQQLSDGTRVFRAEDGSVWTEFDERVKDADVDELEWRGNEPMYEQFKQERSVLEQNRTAQLELRTYQTDVLGSARERLTDHGNPLSVEDMKIEVESWAAQAPPHVLAEIGSSPNNENANLSAAVVPADATFTNFQP